jgi:acetolactate synthase-1/2/3 large subunit
MPTITTGQAVVEVLKAEGVKFVFGMPGGHVLGIYDALYDAPQIRHVLVRHEQVAASMASAHAQLTGEPGICLVTAGPGATNLVTGVAEAFIGALPMVIIAGRGATNTTHRGASQEIATDVIFGPITKWSVRVDRADLVVEVLRQAFMIARSGKPGPVLVDIPRDLLSQNVVFENYLPTGSFPRVAPERARVEAALDGLLKAKRPIVIAGGGTAASGASAQLLELAEALALPVLTSLSGRGSIAEDHPLAVGGLGCHRTDLSKAELAQADYVLSLGCRFEEMETNWRPGFVPNPEAFYVQVDIDPQELGRSIVPRLAIVGDIKLTLLEMLRQLRASGKALASGGYRSQPRIQALADARDTMATEAAGYLEVPDTPINAFRAVMEIRKAFPRETTVSLDVGCLAQHMGGSLTYFPVYQPQASIGPSSFYGMGFAAMALPAAKLIHPDRPAVGLVGDGSFQMALAVLPTAADAKLGVTWCVLNDHALGSILDIQDGFFDERRIATELDTQPDFAQLAQACGCYGERVEDPAQIGAALARAQEANRRGVPAVLDFIVSPERTLATREYYLHYAKLEAKAKAKSLNDVAAQPQKGSKNEHA